MEIHPELEIKQYNKYAGAPHISSHSETFSLDAFVQFIILLQDKNTYSLKCKYVNPS